MGDFDQILNSWLGQFDKGQVPLEANQRISALKDLFVRLKCSGFEKAFFTNNIKARIVTKCINPNHANRKKRRNWAEYVNKHLEIAFHSTFTESVAQEENPLESAPDLKAVEDVNLDEIIEEHSESIKEKDTTEVYLEPPKHLQNFADTVKKDNSIPEIQPDFDPEMARLLGIDLK